MRKLLRHFLLIIILVSLIHCSESYSGSMQRFGRTILGFVGLSPAVSVFEASEGLTKAIQDPTSEEEYHLGRAVAAQVLGRYGSFDQGPLLRFLNMVGATAALYSERPEIFDGYHFFMLQSDQVNALAAPGGFVFITSAMTKLLADEDSLAAILAHEIAHVELRHGIKSIQQSSLDQALESLGTAAGSVQCAQVMQQAAAVFDAAVGDIVTTILEKGYSREQELEADRRAVQILAQMGYQPTALQRVLATLQLLEAEAQDGWFDTHPSPSVRLAALADTSAGIAPAQSPHAEKFYQIRTKRFLQQVRGQL